MEALTAASLEIKDNDNSKRSEKPPTEWVCEWSFFPAICERREKPLSE